MVSGMSLLVQARLHDLQDNSLQFTLPPQPALPRANHSLCRGSWVTAGRKLWGWALPEDPEAT